MFGVGILYLFFEKSILANSRSAKTPLASPQADGISRIVLGAQVSWNIRVSFAGLTVTQ
jgi:phosphatidylinositol glycan class N